jgi:hypothetical protein
LAFDIQAKQMIDDLTADEVVLLKLEPHATCGFVRVTFISEMRIAPGGLPPPFASGRPGGSALYSYGDAGRARPAASHPQRPALSLIISVISAIRSRS